MNPAGGCRLEKPFFDADMLRAVRSDYKGGAECDFELAQKRPDRMFCRRPMVKPGGEPVENTKEIELVGDHPSELSAEKSEGDMMKQDKKCRRTTDRGFTLVEIIVVVVILAIVSLVAIPVFGTAGDMQVRSAAEKIAADLDYAKGLAITHQKTYTVVFSPSEEKYQVQDAAGTVLNHPLRNGQFVEDFRKDRRVRNVNLVSTTLAGHAVTFDYLGAPYGGTDTSAPLDSAGQISLQADQFTMVVTIEPVTGYISIQKP